MTNPPIIETKQNKLTDQFVRISVEIVGDVMRFRRRENFCLDEYGRNMHTGWYVGG